MGAARSPCESSPAAKLTGRPSSGEKEERSSVHSFRSNSSTQPFPLASESLRLGRDTSCCELAPSHPHQGFHSQCKVSPRCCRACSRCRHRCYIICACNTYHQPSSHLPSLLQGGGQRLGRSRSHPRFRPRPPCSNPPLSASSWVETRLAFWPG